MPRIDFFYRHPNENCVKFEQCINITIVYNFQFLVKCFYIFSQVKYQAELKVDKTFTAFEAKTFRTQVVAGTNFAVNVSIVLLF